MTTSERIKRRRLQLGLSLEDVARLIGKNRSTVQRYESNEISNLPASILEPLAKALKTSPAVLMGWDDNSSNFSITIEGETEIKLISDFRKLNENGKDKILENLSDLTQMNKYTANIVKIAARNGQFEERPLSDSEFEYLLSCPDADEF